MLCGTPPRAGSPRLEAHVSNLLSDDHLWHSHQTAPVGDVCGSQSAWRSSRAGRALGGHSQREGRPPCRSSPPSACLPCRMIRCLPHFKAARQVSRPEAALTLDIPTRLRLTTNPRPVGAHGAHQNSVTGEREVCAGHFGLKFKRFELRFASTCASLRHAYSRSAYPATPARHRSDPVCVKIHK